MRQIHVEELDDIAVGAGILGAGGGWDPYIGKLLAKAAVAEHGPVNVVDLEEVPGDALVVSAAMLGAPTVMVEKLPRGDEILKAFHLLEQRLGAEITHIVPLEIGGLNSMMPFCLAAKAGKPLIDADFMGRAFPEVQMVLPTLSGISASPMAFADDKGNGAVIEAIDNKWAERIVRASLVEMGCVTMIVGFAMKGRQVRECTIPECYRTASNLGAVVRKARSKHGDAVSAVAEHLNGRELFRGKVLDVNRRTERGFARAEIKITGFGDNADRVFTLRSQNEHIVVGDDSHVLASVPDLIITLDSESGEPVTTEELRYGFRVSCLVAPCDDRWRSEGGLEVVGPRQFGYDHDYVPAV